MHEEISIVRDSRENNPFKITVSGISHCDGSYKIIRKKSRIYCFEYIYEGEGTVCLDNITIHPKAGDVYWLPARHDQVYYSSADKPWKKIWFNARGELIDKMLEVYNMENINHIKGFNSPELFEKILSIAKSGDNYEHITDKCAIVFQEIVQKLSKHTNSMQIKSEPAKSKLAQLIKSEIDISSDYSINLDSLTDKFFCSKSHMIRIFKESYGITPYKYLMDRKLHDAKIMLTDTVYSIKDISELLCFNDAHNFSHFFKKETGLSPLEYRKSKKS